MPWSKEEEDFFKKNINFTLFIPKLPPLGVGAMKFTVLVFLPNRCYISNLVKIGPVVFEKKMLTDDNGRQPIAIGHLSDSSDLIKCILKLSFYP